MKNLLSEYQRYLAALLSVGSGLRLARRNYLVMQRCIEGVWIPQASLGALNMAQHTEGIAQTITSIEQRVTLGYLPQSHGLFLGIRCSTVLGLDGKNQDRTSSHALLTTPGLSPWTLYQILGLGARPLTTLCGQKVSASANC